MTRCRLPPDPFETPGSWRTISCRMLQLNGFHPDFLSIKHHCQTLLFRRRKKNPRAASFVRTWQGWLEICTWVSTKTCCLDRIEYLKKNNLLYIYIYHMHTFLYHMYILGHARGRMCIYIYDWSFTAIPVDPFSFSCNSWCIKTASPDFARIINTNPLTDS